MTRRRGILAALLATAALALSACAGLPTSGPVNPGLPAGTDAGNPDFSFRPDSPQPGATPEQIVTGFIRAGSGPADNWAVAREYLAPSISSTWDPSAEVTIDVESDRSYASPAEDQVVLTLTAVASTDAIGAYSQVEAGPTEVPFQLAKQDDGEWRITQARDGIVLDRDQFATVFHRYSLMFFDPTWEFLVPDVRWFPAVNKETHIADALVEGGPSPWLAASVVTAFQDVSLARPSVPVVDGVAHVELDDTALAATPDTLSRMQTQLDASLASANVSSVEISVSSTPLEIEPVKTRSTRVSTLPLVDTAEGFGFLSADQLEPLDGLSATMATVTPAAIQVAPDGDFAGVHLVDGTVAYVSADGEVAVFDTRAGLVDPTVDPWGYTWSVPRDAPAGLAAFSGSGERIDMTGAWPDATQIAAMSLSRDGARLAAVVTSGGRPALWIAGVIRDSEGVPSALGDPIPLTQLPGPGVALAWLDDISVGVLTRSSDVPAVVDLVVGGPTATTLAPEGVTQIAGANQATTVRLRAAEGALYVQRGSNWTQTAEGILVLATQQGLSR
jgi:hypothetical protein